MFLLDLNITVVNTSMLDNEENTKEIWISYYLRVQQFSMYAVP